MREPMPDVIVLLPGILGSRLERDGRVVWDLSGGAALRALLSIGHSIGDLALGNDPTDGDDPADGVSATGLLPDLHLVPGLWKIDGYSRIGRTIRDSFAVAPRENYFEFPYDWRRDNRVAARRLDRQARRWLADWRESTDNQEARLVLIGHSMGGLVARYFLEVLGGWEITRALITFGTPYRGSLNALDALANGIRKGPFGLVDLSRLVRSLTSVYQLLPIYPCYDGGDSALARVGEVADIPNVDPVKAAAGLAFHHEIRAAVEANSKQAAHRERGYHVVPVIGIQQPTLQSARLAGNTVTFATTYEGEDQWGDGTVPRVSATPLELDGQPGGMFAATSHGSLQNTDAVLVNLVGVLTDLRLPRAKFRGIAHGLPMSPVRLGLDVPDVFWRDEPITATLLPSGGPADVRVTIADVETGADVATSVVELDGTSRTLGFAPLPPGAYRLTVGGDARVEVVTNQFVVLDEMTQQMGHAG